jgi:Holliday junction resolvase RusA-like endonuclease
MPELTITIPGKPIAKKRPKFFRRGGFVGAYNCQETEEGRAMQQIASQLPAGWTPIDGPVSMRLYFDMPIPSSASKKVKAEMLDGKLRHTKRPDVDNCLKFVKDCFNQIVWRDDCQVYHVSASKFYSTLPKTNIVISWGEK